MTGAAPPGHLHSAVRRRLLAALIALVLWIVGYLVCAISNSVRATGPAELPAREDAGQNE